MTPSFAAPGRAAGGGIIWRIKVSSMSGLRAGILERLRNEKKNSCLFYWNVIVYHSLCTPPYNDASPVPQVIAWFHTLLIKIGVPVLHANVFTPCCPISVP